MEKAAKRRVASGFAHWKRLCHRDRREVEKLKVLKRCTSAFHPTTQIHLLDFSKAQTRLLPTCICRRLVSKIISVTRHAQDRAIHVWREVCLRAKVQSHGRDRDRAVLSRCVTYMKRELLHTNLHMYNFYILMLTKLLQGFTCADERGESDTQPSVSHVGLWCDVSTLS